MTNIPSTITHGYIGIDTIKKLSVLHDKNTEKIKAMAKRIAKTVQRTKVTASLDPMPNDERKIIHQALTDMPHIKTESEGEGNNRHLKIMYDKSKD